MALGYLLMGAGKALTAFTYTPVALVVLDGLAATLIIWERRRQEQLGP